MVRRFGWIVVALGMTALGTASATRNTPTAPAATDAEIGTCVYDCASNGKTYRTRAQCTAVCTSFCEPIC